MKKTIYKNETLAFPIKVEQTGKDRFVVTYGEQVTKGLDYGRAATELGTSIMHALACEGALDSFGFVSVADRA